MMGNSVAPSEKAFRPHVGGRKKSARLPTREVGQTLFKWREPEDLLRLLESERA